MLRRLRSLWLVLRSRDAFERGMTEELRFHIEQYTDDLVRSGLSAEEAARRARLEFGARNSVEHDCRQSRALPFFDELSRQVRYAARLLRKTPGFTITALLTLAVCVGATLTIFAVIDSVLLRPMPFPEPGRLLTIFNTYPKAGVERDGSSLTNYYERRGHIPALSSVSIYRYANAIVGEPGSAERLEVTEVSPEFFSTLGTVPVLGRGFTEEETTFEVNHVAVLTDAYWQRHFHSDPQVLGRQIRVNGRPVTVVGLLPSGFRFLSSEARLYLPLASSLTDRSPLQRHSGGNVTQMIARLKPDATIAQAQSQIDAQNTRLEADDPQAKMMADAGFRSLVVSLHGDHVAVIRPYLAATAGGCTVATPDRNRQPCQPAGHSRSRPVKGGCRSPGFGSKSQPGSLGGGLRNHHLDLRWWLTRSRRRFRRNSAPHLLGCGPSAARLANCVRYSSGARWLGCCYRSGHCPCRTHCLVQSSIPPRQCFES